MGEKKNNGGGGEKKKDDAPVTVVLNIEMHCECMGCYNKIIKTVRGFQGVESVKAESKANKLTLIGKVDPSEVQQRLAEITKKKVELVSPKKDNEVTKKKVELISPKKDNKVTKKKVELISPKKDNKDNKEKKNDGENNNRNDGDNKKKTADNNSKEKSAERSMVLRTTMEELVVERRRVVRMEAKNKTVTMVETFTKNLSVFESTFDILKGTLNHMRMWKHGIIISME